MSELILDLPNGIKTPGGKWTKKVVIDEMTGDEEDILVDQTRDTKGTGTYSKSIPKRLSEILSRVTVSMGDEKRPDGKDRWTLPDFFKDAWAAAFSSDRVFSMIRLRQNTLLGGNDYKFSTPCPTCKKVLENIIVPLNELEVVSIPLADVQKVREVALPKSGDKVQWDCLKGEEDEIAVSAIMENQKDQFISSVMYRKIKKVNGDPVTSEKYGGLQYVKRMNVGDRRYIGTHFDMNEGGIETDIKITCPKCNVEFLKKLDPLGDLSFFFPSGTSTTSSSISALSPKGGTGTQKEPSASPLLAAKG